MARQRLEMARKVMTVCVRYSSLHGRGRRCGSTDRESKSVTGRRATSAKFTTDQPVSRNTRPTNPHSIRRADAAIHGEAVFGEREALTVLTAVPTAEATR